MCVNPVFYLYGMMDRVTINNEKHCAFNLTYHAFEEPEENFGIKVRFENHKIKVSFIVDGRNHITTETLSCSGDYRCLAA